jgi:molybdopterin-guanine dinucleotide biosynthesis protein A
MIAVVLAGGPPDALVAAEPELANKAFLPIGGTALVERTIAPLRATKGIDRIIAVAPPAAHGSAALADADEIRADGPSIADSLRSGIAGLDPDALVLVTAADLPVLTVVAIEDFLNLAVGGGADVVYACVEQRTHLAKYPNVPHTWAKLKEGTFCGGGCIALRPRAFPALERFLDRLGSARKNPAALATIFGWDAVAKYAIGRLSIAEAERRATKLLGAPVSAAICRYPEIAVNVDRLGDVDLAERLVRSG